jgi:hypothetical protein
MLTPFTPAAQNAGLVQRVQVLRHIGLGRAMEASSSETFFLVAQRADDLQPHGRSHGFEQLGRTRKRCHPQALTIP